MTGNVSSYKNEMTMCNSPACPCNGIEKKILLWFDVRQVALSHSACAFTVYNGKVFPHVWLHGINVRDVLFNTAWTYAPL